ncbi:hypothetical protein CALCODRAFT_380039 [Calocera cornea HHB12733]|uniref:Uncharacterized protein n=1 Tax=Calocera cornea HHB12733 TaxID=1353952 RepID=A0A165ECH5_9BASI|nr:hypothetical protein CALCODRAFT_380039 [Calocera cornea HHB12733]
MRQNNWSRRVAQKPGGEFDARSHVPMGRPLPGWFASVTGRRMEEFWSRAGWVGAPARLPRAMEIEMNALMHCVSGVLSEGKRKAGCEPIGPRRPLPPARAAASLFVSGAPAGRRQGRRLRENMGMALITKWARVNLAVFRRERWRAELA